MKHDALPALSYLLAQLDKEWPGRARVSVFVVDRDSDASTEIPTACSPAEIAGEIRTALLRAVQVDSLVALGRAIVRDE